VKKRNLRIALKWALPLNFAFLGLILLDYFSWGGLYAVPLLVLYALFLVWLVILLMLRPTAPLTRFETEPEHRTIIVYARKNG
jgi:hypothetical protein